MGIKLVFPGHERGFHVEVSCQTSAEFAIAVMVGEQK